MSEPAKPSNDDAKRGDSKIPHGGNTFAAAAPVHAMSPRQDYLGRPDAPGARYYTRNYTLEEAIESASLTQSELEPHWVYGKLPPMVQDELDRLANHRFAERFLSLSEEHKRTVMGSLLKELRHQKSGSGSEHLSIAEALGLARDGIADPVRLFSALPENFRRTLDAVSRAHGASGFCGGTSGQQVAVMDSLLREMAAQEAKSRAEEEAKRRAEEENKCRAEEDAKRRAQEEARRREEQEAKRREAITASRRTRKECIMCGLPLGAFDRLLKRERHPRCNEWKG